MANSPWIIEARQETFEQDVIERSREVPVVVDFWAAWCQPCRMLGPILEKLADEYQGKFLLAKANTEQMPEVAAAFQVDAIPSVFALRDGSVVDEFRGLLPEESIRQWLQRILPSSAELLAAEARELEATDPSAAEAKYRQALEQSPHEVAARIGLARTVFSHGNVEEARQIIQELADAGLLDAEGERLQAEILLKSQAAQTGTVAECRAAVEADPGNLPLQLDLARTLAAEGQSEEALETCLRVVQKDRRGMGEPARELMVHLFHVLGPESELASAYRRKLALALY